MHFVVFTIPDVFSGGGGGEGDVLEIVTWNQSSYRGGVKVRWKDTKKEGVYRMSGEGCIDVIYINDVMSDQYYLTHLPAVGRPSWSRFFNRNIFRYFVNIHVFMLFNDHCPSIVNFSVWIDIVYAFQLFVMSQMSIFFLLFFLCVRSPFRYWCWCFVCSLHTKHTVIKSTNSRELIQLKQFLQTVLMNRLKHVCPTLKVIYQIITLNGVYKGQHYVFSISSNSLLYWTDIVNPGKVVLKPSDKIRVNLNKEEFASLQDNKIYGGWTGGMIQVCRHTLGNN